MCSNNSYFNSKNFNEKMVNMEIINYFSSISFPIIIFIIMFVGMRERINAFDIFSEGAKNGLEVIIKLFPTLLAIFLAIGLLRDSGIIEYIINFIAPITNKIGFPSEVMPLALMKPISGSAAIGIGKDIMQTYGVDSKIGLIAATIMGSTETTLYTIAVYTSVVGIKNIRFVLFVALLADFVGMLISVVFWQLMS